MKEKSLLFHLEKALGGFIFEFFMALMRFLPFGFFRIVVKLGMKGYYLISWKLRRNAIESLTIAYGDKLSLAEKKRLAWKLKIPL